MKYLLWVTSSHVLSCILVALVFFLLTFAATFAISSLYIKYKRRTIKRFSFKDPAEPYVIRRDQELDKSPSDVGIDGARSGWQREKR